MWKEVKVKVKNEESRIDRSMGYRSTDVVATRPGRDRRDLRLLFYLLFLREIQAPSTFFSFIPFSFHLSLDPRL